MPVLSSGTVRTLAGKAPASSIIRFDRPTPRHLTYAAMWRAQPALRTVVDFLSRNVSLMGIRSFDLAGAERVRLDRDHPVARWCDQSAPQIGSVAYLGRVVADVALFDRHLSIIHAGDGRVWTQPIPTSQWEPLGGTWMGPEAFRINSGTLGGRTTELDPSQVVHIAGYDPDTIGAGCSPVEALRQILAADYEAERERAAFWSRSARVSTIIERPIEAPKWSLEAKSRFNEQFGEAYGRGGSNEGGTVVLEDGMTAKPFAVTPKDAQYLESRKLSREETAAEYHIPAPFVGILDHATFSNISEQRKMLMFSTLSWWFRRIEQAYRLQFVAPLFGPDIVLDFDEWNRLAGSPAEQAQTLTTAVGGPWMLRDEARQAVGLGPVDGGDVLITPMNVTVGGQPAPTVPLEVPQPDPTKSKGRGPRSIRAAASAAQTQRVADVLTKTWTRQRDAMLASLGAKSSSFDRARYDRELTADLLAVSTDLAATTAAGVYRSAGLNPSDASADPMSAYLAKKAKAQAEAINDTTEAEIDAALEADDPADEITTRFDARLGTAVTFAVGLASAVVGFAAQDTAKAVGYGSKTWIVNSSNSRHPELDGETVAIGEAFSNGASWPGDDSAGVDEAAGCTCDMEITYGGET